ncbi:hypothetical protein Tsubulata_029197 [Turnera subulata]|uniref:DUF4283 domain-containing protein n=1 Tax=Turnera subulata TaxID=218843 RepID=A0A9Q0J086_9ROSI|nr:hypothetical protein Tsubulata_029197 [Turnera subulata]
MNDLIMFREWEDGDGASNRNCWLNIYGVPPHARCEDFFNLVAIRFGKFIHLYNCMDNSDDLEVARVQISTTYKKPISRSFKTKIGNKFYEVTVCEAQPYCPLVTAGDHDHQESSEWEDRSIAPCSISMEGPSESGKAKGEGSNDPFGILDTIKGLKKGKKSRVDCMPKKGKSTGQRNNEAAHGTRGSMLHGTTLPANNLTIGSKKVVTSKEKNFRQERLGVIILQNETMGLDMRPKEGLGHQSYEHERIHLENVETIPSEEEVSDTLSSGRGLVMSRQEGSIRSLNDFSDRILSILERTNRNQSLRIKRKKKVTDTGSMKSLLPGESSTQDRHCCW